MRKKRTPAQQARADAQKQTRQLRLTECGSVLSIGHNPHAAARCADL
jgi:hypothetical protein